MLVKSKFQGRLEGIGAVEYDRWRFFRGKVEVVAGLGVVAWSNGMAATEVAVIT